MVASAAQLDEGEVMERVAGSVIGTAAGLREGIFSKASTPGELGWSSAARRLGEHLDIDIIDGSEQDQRRVLEYYLPVVEWVAQTYQRHCAQAEAGTTERRPLVIGISAPQGCGKSTIVDALVSLLPGAHCDVAHAQSGRFPTKAYRGFDSLPLHRSACCGMKVFIALRNTRPLTHARIRPIRNCVPAQR